MPHTRYTLLVPKQYGEIEFLLVFHLFLLYILVPKEPTGRGGRPVKPILSLTPSSWKILINCVDDHI